MQDRNRFLLTNLQGLNSNGFQMLYFLLEFKMEFMFPKFDCSCEKLDLSTVVEDTFFVLQPWGLIRKTSWKKGKHQNLENAAIKGSIFTPMSNCNLMTVVALVAHHRWAMKQTSIRASMAIFLYFRSCPKIYGSRCKKALSWELLLTSYFEAFFGTFLNSHWALFCSRKVFFFRVLLPTWIFIIWLSFPFSNFSA